MDGAQDTGTATGAVTEAPIETGTVGIGTEQAGNGYEGVEKRSEVDAPTGGETSNETSPDLSSDGVAANPFAVDDFQLEGVAIQFSIPSEGVQMVIDAGLDMKTLADEYKQGGLSEQSLKALHDKHGKFVIDSLLSNLDASLKSALNEYNSNIEAAFKAVTDSIGGEEEWAKLEEFAQTLPQEAIDNFNKAMSSGDPYFQKLAAQDMHSMMSPKSTSEPQLRLIEGSGGASGAATACTAQEYHDAIVNGEYAKDPQKWDNLRRVGQSQGL